MSFSFLECIPFLASALDLTITVDDIATIYADGEYIGQRAGAGGLSTYTVSDDVTLIAVEAENQITLAGLRMELSNGHGTGAHVRCTDTHYSGV